MTRYLQFVVKTDDVKTMDEIVEEFQEMADEFKNVISGYYGWDISTSFDTWVVADKEEE